MDGSDERNFQRLKSWVSDWMLRNVCSLPLIRDDFLLYLLKIFDRDFLRLKKEIEQKPHAYCMFALGYHMYEEGPQVLLEKRKTDVDFLWIFY